MATTPEPSQGAASDGWTLRQISRDIPLTASASEVIELAQRLATQSGSARTEPLHLLAAIVALPKNPAHRGLSALKADIPALASAPEIVNLDASRPSAAAPIGTATRYLLNNAHREAEQLGHHRVDALHLMLALLYKDSTQTAQRLEAAGLSIYAVRQYLAAPASAPKGVTARPLPRLDGAMRISPIFAVPLGALVLGGLALWFAVAPGLTLPITILFVLGGWVTSLCIHEFGHALIGFLGGDRSVASAGYLSLNPLKYTHPLLSIGLPIAFLLLGGIGLPGGAVYLDQRAIRSDGWRSFASAGGPLGNLLFAVLIGWPFVVFRGSPPIGDFHFWAALAFVVFLQVTAIVLNLIPIPPFDGIIAPWLSIDLRILASRLGMLPLLLLFFVLWTGGPISAAFWNFVYAISSLLQVPEYLVFIGQQQFHL